MSAVFSAQIFGKAQRTNESRDAEAEAEMVQNVLYSSNPLK